MAITTSPTSDVAVEPQATVFSLNGTPLLSRGRSDRVVARTEDMTNRVKVYAEGGENALHTHLYEDHVFLVLAGQATFYLGKEERPVVVNRFEGVLLPKGAFYRFQSSGDENLVLFRSGAGKRRPDDRMGPDGRPLAGDSEENKHVPGVEAPGRAFGA
jgi:mannose-6-phosphate isomerase-like protein (cupin superfamily)